MTDELMMLRAARPEIDPAPTHERSKARAALDELIAGENTPGQRRDRGTRSVRRTLTAAAIVIVVALVGVMWPASTQSALAGWDSTPRVVSSAEAEAIEDLCREYTWPPGAPDRAGPPIWPTWVEGLVEFVHVDRRGTTAYAYFAGSSGQLEAHLGCIVTLENETWGPQGTAGSWTTRSGPRHQATAHLYDPGIGYHGNVDVAHVYGTIDDEVAEVIVIRDGEPIAARLTGTVFTAFWPADGEPLDVSLRLLDEHGTEISQYTYPLTPRSE